ncbi:MAG TPA: EamA family transporter [Acidimicrobiales bacterium]|nr:EamA family transporter [Acidimicrobiales bacterium]
MRRVLLLAFIWGWSFLLIKVALRGMPPAGIAFTRIVLGAVVVGAIVRGRRLPVPTDRRTWRHFAVMGLAYSALPFSLLAWGQQHITSALASVMNAGTPLFAAIAAAVGLHERLRLPQVVGLVLGFVGVAVAAGVGGEDLAASSLAGAGGALGAAACYGFGFAYAQRYVVGIPPLVAVFGQLVTGSVLVAPAAAAAVAGEGVDLDGRVLLSVALLGAFGTGVAYVLNYQSIAAVGPTRASLVTYLVPVVAITVGVVFLDEPFRLRLLVGAGLVVLGIALLQERLSRFRRIPMATAAVVLMLLLVGCRGGAGPGGATACGAAVREPLDPAATRHVLPGAPEPTYATDPPTSGPHQAGPSPTGVVDEPLPRPVQVAVLEQGGVVVQYREAGDRAALAPLGGERVVVAPNPALPVRVVATAWRQKLACTSLDVDTLRAFIAAPRSSPGH